MYKGGLHRCKSITPMICKHLVLTGSSGFLGKHLLHSFLTSSSPEDNIHYKIHTLYNSHADFDQLVATFVSDLKDIPSCSIVPYALDFTNSLAIDTWLEKELPQIPVIDCCIHVAALANPGQCEKNPELAEKVNVPSAFFDALTQKKNCQKIIALSTDHVYNQPCLEQDIENLDLQPINVYGRTKLAMEQYLMGPKGPPQVICLRSSIILGRKTPIAPESSHSTFLHFCASRDGQETTFWSDEMRNVIWVEDVIASIRWLVDHDIPKKSVFNMGGPNSVSRLDMAKAVFEHFLYDTKWLISKEKMKESPAAGGAPSPLDISMDSSRLQKLVGRSFADLEAVIRETF